MNYDNDLMVELYDEEVINYLKILSYKVESVKLMGDKLEIVDYTIEDFLKYMLPISEARLDYVKRKIIDNDNEGNLLDLILISNELSRLIIEEHVELIKTGYNEKLVYKMDEFAVNKLNKKFGMKLSGNTFSIEDDDFEDYETDGEIGMSLN